MTRSIQRRGFLFGTTALIPFGVSGCASFNIDKSISELVTYGKALFNGIKSVWLQLQNSPLLSFVGDDVKSTITTAGKAVGALLDELSAVQTIAQAQPIVAKLGTYVQAALSAFLGIQGLPPTITHLLSAAQIVLPVLQSLVGIGIATVEQVKEVNKAKATLLAAPVS